MSPAELLERGGAFDRSVILQRMTPHAEGKRLTQRKPRARRGQSHSLGGGAYVALSLAASPSASPAVRTASCRAASTRPYNRSKAASHPSGTVFSAQNLGVIILDVPIRSPYILGTRKGSNPCPYSLRHTFTMKTPHTSSSRLTYGPMVAYAHTAAL